MIEQVTLKARQIAQKTKQWWIYKLNTVGCYIELPFGAQKPHLNRTQRIGIGAGVSFGWETYIFDLCDSPTYFPRGRKVGSHRFSVTIGLLHWYATVTFYKPKAEVH